MKDWLTVSQFHRWRLVLFGLFWLGYFGLESSIAHAQFDLPIPGPPIEELRRQIKKELCELDGGWWDDTSDYEEEYHCVCPANTVLQGNSCVDPVDQLDQAGRRACESKGGEWKRYGLLGTCDCPAAYRWSARGFCELVSYIDDPTILRPD